MGQYHYVVNVDKSEYLHPHQLGDGLKLLEFGASAGGTLLGLTILLNASPDRGGGDIHEPDTPGDQAKFRQIVGRWAGDRIAIVGDYQTPNDLPFTNVEKVWSREGDVQFLDISKFVVDILVRTGEMGPHSQGRTTSLLNDEPYGTVSDEDWDTLPKVDNSHRFVAERIVY